VPATAASKRTARDPGRGFRGWSPTAVEFFDRIEVENTKAFWTAHKDVYQAEVLAPMELLLAELAAEFGEGSVFRPYRDTRFSSDKSPYKTNIAAHNDAGYITLNANVLGVGAGLYMPAPDQLTRYRSAVDAEHSGEELSRLVATLKKKGIDVSAHDVLKTAPRGYPADHKRIELLRYKGLTAWRDWPIGPWLGTASAKTRIVQFLRDARLLRDWLDTYVGGTDAH